MTKKEIIKERYYGNPSFNRRKLATELSVSTSYIRKTIRSLKKNSINIDHKPIEETINFNKTSKNSAKLELESLTITTLEQALEVAKVDLTQWSVDRYNIGSWQVTLKIKKDTGQKDSKGNVIYRDEPKVVTMYKIQVWLKKLHNMEWVEAIRNLITELPKLKTPKKEFKLDGEYLLEVALADTHFGLLAWKDETQYDYDLKIAEEVYLYAICDLLNKTKYYKPSKILMSIGNDFLHINDQTNQTPTSHNILDVDSRLIKIYQKAKLAVIKAVNYAREIAPVHICWVPGNHDPASSYFLVDCIDAIFENDEDVTVNKGARTRKFYNWGKNLIIFTHGMDEKLQNLPVICATEEPELWGKSLFREVHIGHTHAKKAMVWTGIETKNGIIIRTIPSIATVDSWHYRKGFIKNNFAAQAFLWKKDGGMVGSFTSYVDELYKNQK